MKPQFSLDRLSTIDPKAAGMGAMAALTRLQDFPPESQVAGVALLFSLLCKQYGVHHGNAMQIVKNLADHALAVTPELRAAKLYVENQL